MSVFDHLIVCNVQTGVPPCAVGVEAQHGVPLQSGRAFRRAQAPREHDVARGRLLRIYGLGELTYTPICLSWLLQEQTKPVFPRAQVIIFLFSY